ncbi:hypothetical protein ACI2KC_16110 [Pseudomonas monteilii]
MENGGYNFIYTELVKNEDDILGIIAYSLYKRQKIEFIKAFKAKHGRDPTDADLSHFHEVSNSSFQLQAYRDQADKLAQDFLTISLETRAEALEQYYETKTTDAIRGYKPSFWLGVSQGVVASIIFVLLLGVLVIFTWSLNQGPRQVIEQIFDVKILNNPSAPRDSAGESDAPARPDDA